jgi:hypothetical protein
MIKNSVVLYMTHFLSPQVIFGYSLLCKELSDNYDVVMICDNTKDTFDVNKLPEYTRYFLFNEKHIENFNYPKKNYLHPGKIYPLDTDYVFLDYFCNNPDYQYYWIMEYDVMFSGNWSDFFSHFESSTSDMLATNVHKFSVFPEWPLWKTLKVPDDMNLEQSQLIRAFFPLCRLSRQALEKVDRAYKQGWAGSYEVTFGTLLNSAGLTIEDFGGAGEFVKPENENRFYTSTMTCKDLSPGTFVYRPIMRKPGLIKNKLWHPVKEKNLLLSVKKLFSVLFWKEIYWNWLSSRSELRKK